MSPTSPLLSTARRSRRRVAASVLATGSLAATTLVALPAIAGPAQAAGSSTTSTTATTQTTHRLVAPQYTGKGAKRVPLHEAPYRRSGSAVAASSPTGSPSVFAGPSYFDVFPSTAPSPRDRPMMTYDAARQQTVLFGGCTSASPCASAETWVWDGTTWTKKSPATSPPARYAGSFAYDPATGNSVLFGGETGTTELSDTWVWDGTTWTQRSPATHPSQRDDAAAAYLSSIGKVVLFGGDNTASSFNDTWTWDGTTWTQLSPASPPGVRSRTALVPTGSSQGLLLYGGQGPTGTDLGDTWTFDGTAWTQRPSPATPGPLERFSAAFNPQLGVATIVGGWSSADNDFTPTMWAWTGSDWQEAGGNLNVSYGTVDGFAGAQLAQAPADSLLAFGGYKGNGSSSTLDNETYVVTYLPLGDYPSANVDRQPIDDRLDVGVNAASGDLMVHAKDLRVHGVGLDLTFDRYFNSIGGGGLSHIFPDRWLAGLLDGEAHPTPGGSRVVTGIGGQALFFGKNADGSFTAPSGADMSLKDNGDGTLTLKNLHAQVTYTFSGYYLTKVADRNGNAISIVYNGNHPITITDTQGRTYQLAYDTTTNYLASITDPSGRKVAYTYDANSQLSTVQTIAAGGAVLDTTIYANDGFGITTITDPDGKQTKLSFGPMNRGVSVTRVTDTTAGTGPKRTFAYAQGKVTETDPRGNKTTYNTDMTGSTRIKRVAKALDPLGHTRSSSYDASENVTSVSGNTVSSVFNLSYDNNNSVTKAQAPDMAGGGAGSGSTTTLSYLDTAHPLQPSKQTDGQGNATSYSYNSKGNLATVTTGLASQNQLKNAYQGDTGVNCGPSGGAAKPGELCSATDPRGNVTNYAYDASGNVVKVTPPAPLGSTTIVPDALGRFTSVTDAKGQRTTYSYDAADRITQLLLNGTTTCSTSAGTCITYAYDAAGNLTSRVDKTGTTTFGYDALNRPYLKTFPGGGTSQVGYDANGNVTSYTDAGGTVSYGYDPANNLWSLAEPGGSCPAYPTAVTVPNSTRCTGFAYDNDNRRTSVNYPSGEKVTMGYDSAGRQTSVVAKRPSGTTFVSRTYSYTNPSTGKDTDLRWKSTDEAGTVTTYGYDAVNRLTSATVGGTTYAYAYDGSGNRTSYSKTGAATVLYGYDNADQLCWSGTAAGSNGTTSCPATPAGDTAYAYDAHGNQTSGGRTFAYNSLNQTTSITNGTTATGLGYADVGQSERTTVGSTSLLNGLVGLASQTTGGASIYFTRDPNGNLIGLRQGAGSTSTNSYYVVDAQGSVLRLTDAAGTTDVASYGYDPYGVTLSATGSLATTNPFRFAHGYYDASTGLLKIGTRYYDPAIGRWTQTDPLPGSIGDPGQLNRYVYVGDSPASNVDPAGTSFLSLSGTVNLGFAHVSIGADIGDGGFHPTVGVGVGPKADSPVSFGASLNRGTARSGGSLSANGCLAGACASEDLIHDGKPSTRVDLTGGTGASVDASYTF